MVFMKALTELTHRNVALHHALTRLHTWPIQCAKEMGAMTLQNIGCIICTGGPPEGGYNAKCC